MNLNKLLLFHGFTDIRRIIPSICAFAGVVICLIAIISPALSYVVLSGDRAEYYSFKACFQGYCKHHTAKTKGAQEFMAGGVFELVTMLIFVAIAVNAFLVHRKRFLDISLGISSIITSVAACALIGDRMNDLGLSIELGFIMMICTCVLSGMITIFTVAFPVEPFHPFESKSEEINENVIIRPVN